MSNLTVILPAAGKGTRLNLPYPKEILRLDKDHALIDNCFNFFRNYGRKDVEFVVVINENKPELLTYLAKYKDRFNISFIYQDPNEQEYTGAIKSAKPLFGEYNLVLLPDTIMKLKRDGDLYKLTKDALTETGFAFLYKKETSEDILKTKGALEINNDGLVINYCDKPKNYVQYYNAFWCAFAFRRRTFNSCMEFMEKSTLQLNVEPKDIQSTPIYGSKAIEVEDYIDLGTWAEIRRLLLSYEKDNQRL